MREWRWLGWEREWEKTNTSCLTAPTDHPWFSILFGFSVFLLLSLYGSDHRIIPLSSTILVPLNTIASSPNISSPLAIVPSQCVPTPLHLRLSFINNGSCTRVYVEEALFDSRNSLFYLSLRPSSPCTRSPLLYLWVSAMLQFQTCLFTWFADVFRRLWSRNGNVTSMCDMVTRLRLLYLLLFRLLFLGTRLRDSFCCSLNRSSRNICREKSSTSWMNHECPGQTSTYDLSPEMIPTVLRSKFLCTFSRVFWLNYSLQIFPILLPAASCQTEKTDLKARLWEVATASEMVRQSLAEGSGADRSANW